MIRDRVLAAAAPVVWVPPPGKDVRTDEYWAKQFPGRTSVQWSDTRRPLADLVGELRTVAGDAGHEVLRWWVNDEYTRPTGTGAALLSMGFELVEVLDVLALELRGDHVTERLAVPADVSTVAVEDVDGLRVARRVDAQVFGWSEPSEEELVQEVARLTATRRWYLAFLDGEPVGGAGCDIADGVVRLRGAGVLPGARGRGVYRALTAARCRFGLEQGVTLALAKARAGTSGPVLRRAGFLAYGVEQCYQLRLG